MVKGVGVCRLRLRFRYRFRSQVRELRAARLEGEAGAPLRSATISREIHAVQGLRAAAAVSTAPRRQLRRDREYWPQGSEPACPPGEQRFLKRSKVPLVHVRQVEWNPRWAEAVRRAQALASPRAAWHQHPTLYWRPHLPAGYRLAEARLQTEDRAAGARRHRSSAARVRVGISPALVVQVVEFWSKT